MKIITLISLTILFSVGGAVTPSSALATAAKNDIVLGQLSPRDNSGTSTASENTASSQTQDTLGFASRVSFQAEGMGFEPDADFTATGVLPCVCVICPECRAARALQTGRLQWLESALNDADLQRVIAAWADLPDAIRRAMLALIG